ncbi:hypothetical protein O6H91_12G016300 [Diphasiastrum complanatum]|uniref:Uncharacterized protein n=1 Tax=Diphasiastrum complanatum TaxID=34168 RepID=A0ACC2BZ50_DIPCM|nr:hypothetical protein O6H91_12G016300 [Diphasiastrum complanatum]
MGLPPMSSLVTNLSSLFSRGYYKQLNNYLMLWKGDTEAPFESKAARPKGDDEPMDKDGLGSRLQEEKVKFLELYGEEYGYSNGAVSIDDLRTNEFTRLKGTTYLDHAGATLYSEAQMQAVFMEFSASLYGNPHSQSSSSKKTTDIIERARREVLSFFHAPEGEYKCIFTSGATAALKLVGEAFPWHQHSDFYYTMENHNSVLGIREYALARGATVTAVDVEPSTSEAKGQWPVSFRKRDSQNRFLKDDQNPLLEVDEVGLYNLFAFPSECNFSGVKFDLDLIKFIQDGGHVSPQRGRWLVLLDAAKGSATLPPDLSHFPADFVAVSFYKIFGYPTGLGALLVRSDTAKLLEKKYFGGDVDFFKKRERLEHWLEDGTTSFLGIAALHHGFATINKLGASSIMKHTWALTRYTASRLAALRHWNGASVCALYGNHDNETRCHDAHSNQGPVVTFNLKRSDGSWVGYREVENLAILSGINLRTGCFCNPGACAKYLGLSNSDLKSNFEAGHVCWDDQDLIRGRPTGAVRISYAYMSSFEDCWALLEFIQKFFVEDSPILYMSSSIEEKVECYRDAENTNSFNTQDKQKVTSNPLFLESISVYPIKSCAGFSPMSWPLGDCGLLYDREWVIMGVDGTVLTQKKVPSMCLVRTSIDLSLGQMHVEAAHMDQGLDVSIFNDSSRVTEQVEVCGRRSDGEEVGPPISQWFSKALGLPCTLVRRKLKSRKIHFRPDVLARNPFQRNGVDAEQAKEMGFANEGQFLLVSKASLDDLNRRLSFSDEQHRHDDLKNRSHSIEASQFRPNIVVSGGKPYDEDNWQTMYINNAKFLVLGACNRCQMVNVNQSTGDTHPQSQPLLTLSSYRRVKGKILFGILLVQDGESQPGLELHISTMSRPENDFQRNNLLKVGSEVIISS